jgi:glycosyltransferase involved in cell wall biosynthesis
MDPQVAVIVPVMRRPQSVRALLNSYQASNPTGDLYFVVDHDDGPQREAVESINGNEIVNFDQLKTFARKCNLGYRLTHEPWLLFVGDDVVFHENWQQNAFAECPDKAFISTNDLLTGKVTNGLHAVHPIVSREFIDNVGTSWDGPCRVCHEGYKHYCVDLEWTAVAKNNNQFCFSPTSVIEHVHPIGGAEVDPVYKLAEENAVSDDKLWRQRLKEYNSNA